MKRKNILVLFAVLWSFMTCFIFYHSTLSPAQSGARSEWVMGLIKPILDPGGTVSEDTFHYLIRKAGHFAEFGALGACVGGFFVNLGRVHHRRYTALMMLVTLLTAVADEYLQYFTGRGSMVTDVVLDYCGGLFGVGIAVLITIIQNRRKRSGPKP